MLLTHYDYSSTGVSAHHYKLLCRGMEAASTHYRRQGFASYSSKELASGVKDLHTSWLVHTPAYEDIQLRMPAGHEGAQPAPGPVVVLNVVCRLEYRRFGLHVDAARLEVSIRDQIQPVGKGSG